MPSIRIASRLEYGRVVKEFVSVNLVEEDLEVVRTMTIGDEKVGRTSYTVKEIIALKSMIEGAEHLIRQNYKDLGLEIIDCGDDPGDYDWDLEDEDDEEEYAVDWDSMLPEEETACQLQSI